jgi:hypothetical protein
MLTEAKEYLLNDINAKLDVYLYGQELNEQARCSNQKSSRESHR